MLCPKMFLLQFAIICATLFHCSFGAPWETNNVREFDLEWQCQQFCDRLKGNLTYNSPDSECICAVDKKHKSAIINSNHLERKLSDLGLNFKVVDKTKANKIIKRETASDKLKKISEIQSNDIGENHGPNPEHEGEEHKDDKMPLGERLHRLRSKLLITKPVITAPDNAAPNIVKEEKPEDEKLKSGKIEIKDATVVGDVAAKAESFKNNVKEDIRLKVAAMKDARNNLKQPNSDKEPKAERKLPNLHLRSENEGENRIQKRLQELRERLRMRLESRRGKPNEDGHVEENKTS